MELMMPKRGSIKKARSILLFVAITMAIVVFFASFSSAVVKDTSVDPNTDNYYVGNPANCVWKSSVGNDCPKDGTAICGSDSGEDYCYNVTGDMAQDPNTPSSNTTAWSNSYSIEDSNNNPGYVLNCFSGSSSQGDSVPYCNNDGNYWCQTNSTCDNDNRKTKCIEGKFAYESGSSVCTSTCRNGYTSCDGPNDDSNGCEIDQGLNGCNNSVSGGQYPTSNTCNATINDAKCEARSGYYDCDNDVSYDGTNWNGDFEIESGESCTTDSGLEGTCQVSGSDACGTSGTDSNGNDCNCVPGKSKFETGTKTQYSTNQSEEPILSFKNLGQGDLINATNSIGESWRVNNESCIVLKDGEEICDKGDVGGNTSWNLSGNDLYPEDTDYNLGIGTGSVTDTLTVNGTANITGNVTSGKDFCIQGGKCLSSSSSGTGRWNLSGSNLYTEDTSYSVGIGTDSPTSSLNVLGNIDFEGVLNMTGNNIKNVSTVNPERNTSFGNSVNIPSGEKYCLDGNSCNHYIKYNGSGTVIE